MSAPEPQPQDELKIVPMTSVVPLDGQRSLAAIVFTDTVDFSALMSRDEDRARRLVSRDLGQMRLICGRFDGEIVKSTGDGLLLLFTSAVQAVSCALEIQQNFRDRNRALPSSERLRHRIGIHLGDVIRQHDDVMGDGVNIASRLQSEGSPGGVCISGTVYEVVQNRLPFYIVSRKARKLKNVGTVTVYQISPREGAGHLYFRQAWHWLFSRQGKRLKALLITAVVLTITYFTTHWNVIMPDHESTIARRLNPLGPPPPVAGAGADSADDDDDDDASSYTTPSASSHPVAPGLTRSSDQDFAVARFNDMKAYDFAAMRAWLETHDSPDVDEVELVPVANSLQQLFDWCYAHLPAYSADHPLLIQDENQNLEFSPAPGGLALKTVSGLTTLPRSQVPPLLMAEIAAQLINDNAPAHTVAAAHLWRGLRYFIAAYGIKAPHALTREAFAGSRDVSSDTSEP